MAHSPDDVYLMVMTGGYRAADIERWAKEIVEEAYDEIYEEGYAAGLETGYNDGYDEALSEALKYLER